MRYTKWLVALLALLILTVPQVLLASTLGGTSSEWARNMIGIASLVTGVILMLDVLALRRVAHGGAISQNISYLVLGVICLAASVLVGWVGMFMPTQFSTDQARLAADGLILIAMVLMAMYFFRVRSALVGYLKAAEQYAASVQATDPEDAPGA